MLPPTSYNAQLLNQKRRLNPAKNTGIKPMDRFEIEGSAPLCGNVRPSGNKNEALPALMACLLTDQEITFRRMPRIRDVETVVEILRELGAAAEWSDDGENLTVCASSVDPVKTNRTLCQKVRASVLLIGPLLARVGTAAIPLPGGDVIGARRIDTHVDGLRALGAKIHFDNGLHANAKTLIGTSIYLDEPSVTATENLLIASVTADGRTTLHNAASEPHVVGLCRLLTSMGASIKGIGTNRLEIQGVSKLSGCEHTIGPDFMETGSFLCLAAASKSKLTIQDVIADDLRFPLRVFQRLGISAELSPTESNNGLSNLIVDGTRPMKMATDMTGRTATIYSGPWPAFPTDLMSVAITAATQTEGTMIFFEKMFEGRMFFTDKLISMGANIVLCDPHRAVVNGPSQLIGARMSSPDVRAGMALLIAATVAKGQSTIENIYQIDRGYHGIDKKLQALGAKVRRL